MTETIDIIQFLKTGKFGELEEVHFAMKRAQLITALGIADAVHFAFRKSKSPSIYKYGNVEFYFEEGEEGRLNGIQIIPESQPAKGLNFKLGNNFIKPRLSYKTTVEKLAEESIKYNILEEQFDSEDIIRVETEGGVQLIFSQDFEGEISIYKVNRFIGLSTKKSKENKLTSQ